MLILVVKSSETLRDMLRKYLKSGVIVALSVVLAACGGGNNVISASDVGDVVSNTESSYLIGPGDTLQIFVWDHPDLTTGVQVRPDGRISTPLVEDLRADGRTPTELARDVELVLGEYVVSPVVTVIVQNFVGQVDQQIRVVGEATQPQALQYRQGMRVLDVLIAVGGLSEFASGNRSRVLRRIGGEEVSIRVRLDDLLNDGDVEQNIAILPGDILVIPQSVF